MFRYKPFYQIDPATFLPFNEAPAYLTGMVGPDDRDAFTITCTARRQLQGWHNLGGRTNLLRPHSFTLSVDAYPLHPRGAYSIGVVCKERPSINVGHFLRSSLTLYKDLPGINYYSGWGYDDSQKSYSDKRGRDQRGLTAPFDPMGRHHTLTVGYDQPSHLLYCQANNIPLMKIEAELRDFWIELRMEAVGVDGNMGVRFENMFYSTEDIKENENLARLGAWDAQYAPVFISYSHQDREQTQRLITFLRSRLVRVLGDWDFKVGDSLIERISSSISHAGYLVIVLSPRSVESSWVKQELEIALSDQLERRRVKVLPVLIEPCAVPAFLKSRLYVDLREDPEHAYDKLLQTIRSLGVWD